MECSRYVFEASLEDITISNHRLRWAVDGKRFTAPLQYDTSFTPFETAHTHTQQTLLLSWKLCLTMFYPVVSPKPHAKPSVKDLTAITCNDTVILPNFQSSLIFGCFFSIFNRHSHLFLRKKSDFSSQQPTCTSSP